MHAWDRQGCDRQPLHRDLSFVYTSALIPAPSDLPTFAQICTCDNCPEALPSRVLNAVLHPLCCQAGLNVLFWLDIDTLFSSFFFCLCSVSHSINSYCLCGSKHLLGCEEKERKREEEKVIKRECREGEKPKNRKRERRRRRQRKQVQDVSWK